MGGGPPKYSKENALLSQKSKTKPQTGEVITLRTDEIVKRTSVDIKTEKISQNLCHLDPPVRG